VIDLLQKGRAQVGLTKRGRLPDRYGVTRLPMQTRMGSTSRLRIRWRLKNCRELHGWRELRLSTYLESEAKIARGPSGQRRITCYS
jgi:hypothetical protein